MPKHSTSNIQHPTLYVVGGLENYRRWRADYLGDRKPLMRSLLVEKFDGFQFVRVVTREAVMGLRPGEFDRLVVLHDADREIVEALRERGFKLLATSREVPVENLKELLKRRCCERDTDFDGNCPIHRATDH